MHLRTFLLETLTYHRRTNLAVLLGVVAGTAVLTGALFVGDSVHQSLRDLTLRRLGRIDHALTATSYFREGLAEDLSATQGFASDFTSVAPAILTHGSVAAIDAQGQTEAAAGDVQFIGVDDLFWQLADDAPETKPEGTSILLNESLARDLGAAAGDTLLLHVEQPSAVPRDALLGRRDNIVRTIRSTVRGVVPDRGVGRFGLRASQQLPNNAYVALATLADRTNRTGEVNTLFVAAGTEGSRSAEGSRGLAERLQKVVEPQDLGLRLVANDQHGYVALESKQMILSEAARAAGEEAAQKLGVQTAPALTYLANSITAGERTIPYSTVSALDPTAKPPFGPLVLQDGSSVTELEDDEILLNDWAAKDLGVKPGDEIRLRYFKPESVDGEAVENRDPAVFSLKGIVRMEGPAADPGLTPEYPGITDAENLADWDPPFPLDLGRVRSQDEDYWDQYRGTPKAFVTLAAGKKLWSSRFGTFTALRFAPREGESVEALRDALKTSIPAALPPERAGLVFRPVKAEGLAAADSGVGGKEFGGLFVSFSFFLILSAALLVGLLFRLGVERRATEVGTLLAVGFPLKRVRRVLLAEGAVLAAGGGLLGVVFAAGYAALMLLGLRTWWREAVGTSLLSLHLSAASGIIGYVAAGIVALLAVRWAVARLGKVSVRGLVAGQVVSEVAGLEPSRPSRWPFIIAAACVVVAGVLVVLFQFEAVPAEGAFFGAGAGLLVAFLSFFYGWLRANPAAHAAARSFRRSGLMAVGRLGARNAMRNPGRSVLTAGLIASASFLIIAVESFRHDPAAEGPELHSGNGGFSLLAESTAPVLQSLNTPEGRRQLSAGLGREADGLLDETSFFAFRVRPGDDASCLNLYRPAEPKILGVPQALIDRGGFVFADSIAETPQEKENPWRLLNEKLPGKGGQAAHATPLSDEGGEIAPAVVPAIGDYNTLKWVLHLGLGDQIQVTSDRGQPVILQIAGMLRGSLFQGELLIGEDAFVKDFPSQSGYRFFLVEADPDAAQKVVSVLERNLTEYGFDVTTTAARLASYMAVENTYLSTFQMLGGLGLLLGTFGLATVLLRNVFERRGELALMRCLGFRRAWLAWLVLSENLMLLIAGLAGGVVSALLAVAPHLAGAGATVPIGWLSLMLALVLAAGLLAGLVGVVATLRAELLPALRAE